MDEKIRGLREIATLDLLMAMRMSGDGKKRVRAISNCKSKSKANWVHCFANG
jgi:hypothetical protein